MKTKVMSTLYIEELMILPLSVFIGHSYLQHGGQE